MGNNEFWSRMHDAAAQLDAGNAQINSISELEIAGLNEAIVQAKTPSEKKRANSELNTALTEAYVRFPAVYHQMYISLENLVNLVFDWAGNRRNFDPVTDKGIYDAYSSALAARKTLDALTLTLAKRRLEAQAWRSEMKQAYDQLEIAAAQVRQDNLKSRESIAKLTDLLGSRLFPFLIP